MAKSYNCCISKLLNPCTHQSRSVIAGPKLPFSSSKIQAAAANKDQMSQHLKKNQRKAPLRRLITISTSDGRCQGQWNCDHVFSLRELQLEELAEDGQKDVGIFINLSVQKHAEIGFSVDGKIITTFNGKCSCFKPYSREGMSPQRRLSQAHDGSSSMRANDGSSSRAHVGSSSRARVWSSSRSFGSSSSHSHPESSSPTRRRADAGATTPSADEDVTDHISTDDSRLPEKRIQIQWTVNGEPLGVKFRTEIGRQVRKILSPHHETWKHVPNEDLDTLFSTLQGMYIIPDEKREKILSIAGKRFRNWKHHLVADYIDTKPTIAERKKNKPPNVKQEDWDMFVDMVSTEEYQKKRKMGQELRAKLITPQTTGRRGEDATIELVNGRASTPAAQAKIDDVREVERKDPSSVNKDWDHDAVAQVHDRDGNGRVLGMGNISKTFLRSSGGYQEKFLARDKEAKMYENRVDEMEQQLRHFQGTSMMEPPAVRTGSCILRDILMRTVALAEVIDAHDGSTPDRLRLTVRLNEIFDANTLVIEGGGSTLGQLSVGEVIGWPAYFVTYI